MRRIRFVTALSAPLMLAMSPGAAPAQALRGEAVKVCVEEGVLTVLCAKPRWEDLAPVPGTDWVLASSIDGAGLHAIHARTKADVPLYPAPTARQRPDVATYGTCARAPSVDGALRLTGIAVQRTKTRSKFLVYAVRANGYNPNMGPDRIGVEVFELDLRGAEPSAAWLGCILPPDIGIGLNSLAPLSDGGFLVTNFNGGVGVTREKVISGQHFGQIWYWHPAKGWSELAGSALQGPNGIVASADGRDIYVAAWGISQLVHYRRSGATLKKKVVQLGYRIDNLHWPPNGKITGAGQLDSGEVNVVEIDPRTLKVRVLFQKPATEAFRHFTSAAKVGNEIWIGSSRSSGLGIIPAPR